jgi:hypothetical protein
MTMSYGDARYMIRQAILALMEHSGYLTGQIVREEERAARREYSRRHWEQGPGWDPGPDHCDCAGAGRWGATGIMPNGHLWYWENAEHTAGYLAHAGTGQPRGAPPPPAEEPDKIDALIAAARNVAESWEPRSDAILRLKEAADACEEALRDT